MSYIISSLDDDEWEVIIFTKGSEMKSYLHWNRIFKVISFNNLFFSVVLNDVSNTVPERKTAFKC